MIIIIYVTYSSKRSSRAVAEELAAERGRMPEGSEKHMPWGKVCLCG